MSSWLTDLPSMRPVAVGACGVALITWTYRALSPIGLSDHTKQALIGSLVALTGTWAALSWPGFMNLGGGQASTDAKAAESFKDPLKMAEKAAKQLKRDIQPGPNSDVGTCATVKGEGQIPEGYQIWVGNLNDAAGQPSTGAIFNLQRATAKQGGWGTDSFNVGAPNRTGPRWLHVYLLPEAAGNIIESRRIAGVEKLPAMDLNGPMEGAAMIAEIRVQRTTAHTCPWEKD
ncbi:hypothetical protein ACWCQK_25275 [Streptomyces sp. NPDC002306]